MTCLPPTSHHAEAKGAPNSAASTLCQTHMEPENGLYGMVWYGMVWYGMVWYGMVWYSMVWYGMVWSDMVWDMVWYSMAE